MTNLIGQYQFAKSYFTKIGSEKVSLKLSSRKVPTPQKPKFFLLLVLPDGQCKYVSSLYPVKESSENALQAYSIDWQGQEYTLEINRSTEIATISLNPPLSIP